VIDRLVAVGVPVPGLGRLTYRVPDGHAIPPKGARVNVPVGGRELMGCVIDEHAVQPAAGTLRDLGEILDRDAYLPEHIVELALWVGEYYAAGPGDALTVALPPMASKGDESAFQRVKVAELIGGEAPPPKGSKQQQALKLIAENPGGLALPALQRAGVSGATVKSLERGGWVRVREDVVERDPFQGAADGAGSLWSLAGDVPIARELTPEQALAFRHLEEAAIAGQFRTFVLQGVTGSGKTELYARLADLVLSRGRRVLVLVPEIALTPAVAGLFRARFGRRVTIQHSGLSDGERHDQWHRIRRGDVDVVVGTRSAVFAPLDNVGLVIVDEEHDGAYKQEESPRYHGRDVAVVRGRMESAVVVLGSATPSLESAANAHAGRYDQLTLTERILNRPLAKVRIVDMREEYAVDGPDVIISRGLWSALETRLSLGEQSLVLLNRRGFATVIFCRQCGATLECPHCSVTLTYHRTVKRIRCHYCNYASSIPRSCGTCGGEFLEQSGFGTERIDALIRERFPGARVVRVDRDTIRRRGAIARVLTDVARGDVDILVGTQMIAKGHDFPAVTLVGVISADVGLGLADFRAAERTFQLLTQVVGRAGRGDIAGEALVQTIFPDHYSVRAAAAQDYPTFYDQEIEFRTRMDYPPRVGLINVIVRGKSLTQAMEDAHALAGLVRHQGPKGRIVGPAPAPLSKIKDEYRAQFFLKGKDRRAMREAIMRAIDHKPEIRRRTLIDVDPYSVL
jgi:primosomal protein N' (replication factor Y) (superfamily II helicase)